MNSTKSGITETDQIATFDHRILPRFVIQPSHGWTSIGLSELWEYRELLVFLIWREVQGVYRQTALGLSWLFLRPMVNVVLLSLVFGRLINVPSDDIPYPLFSLAALLPWGYFSNAVQRAARSLVDNMHLISKVYFPRMVIPLSSVASGLVDFGASLIILLLAMLIYRAPLRVEVLWLPLFLLVAMIYALAVGLWLATLSVKYRDVAFAVTFLLQALMYASPVIYSVNLVPTKLQFIYNLNPMTGVIQGFRWALFGAAEAPGLSFGLSIILLIAGLVSGAYIFRRTERTIVDIL